MAPQTMTACGRLKNRHLGISTLSSRLWDLDFQLKCKICFHMKRGLWTTEQLLSPFCPQPVEMLPAQECFDIKNMTFVVHVLDKSVCNIYII